MMRSFLISLSKVKWAQRLISNLGFARRLSRRFVAGETSEEAIQVVRDLNLRGIQASLDHLGENTTRVEEAAQSAQDILSILDSIQKAGVRANVSIKLTQIGLALGEDVCIANLERILQKAREFGNFVRVDMEDSTFTERTLKIYRQMREKGYDNLGVVIQAYLYRSENDVRQLRDCGGRIRLCKGAYQEPAQAAFPKKKDVDTNFDRLVDLLIENARAGSSPEVSQDGRIPPIPAFATHDPARIAYACQAVQKTGIRKESVEFQMLYGIRRDLQEDLARQGYPVRIYVPYGTHWYPYFMRRLAERPANVWFFLKNTIKG